MFAYPALFTALLKKKRTEGKLLVQAEMDTVSEAAANGQHAADQDAIERGPRQHQGRSWRRRGLLAASFVAATALGALAAASWGRNGRR